MTPDRTVQWEKHIIPSLKGALYTDPENRAIGMRVLDYARDEHLRSPDENPALFVRAHRSNCFRESDVVIKAFTAYGNPREPDLEGGLSGLRANIMLEAGFMRTYMGGEEVTWQAPQMFGAFVPSNLKKEYPIWTMSYEEGVALADASDEDVNAHFPVDAPAFYDPIVARVGAQPGDIFYDNNTLNILIHHNRDIGQTVLTKLDVAAEYRYKF
jgi:hypothetical protein